METILGALAVPMPPPYMSSVTNLRSILSKIREAGSPPRFTHEFLRASLGFNSSNDRAIIPILKHLGFLTADSSPTPRYNEFRAQTSGGHALADGLREGWSEIFLADQRANEKTASQLKETFKSVTGKSESVAEKMATSFKALADAADWSIASNDAAIPSDRPAPTVTKQEETLDPSPGAAGYALSLRHDIHIHLPPTSDVAVYKAVFRALREELGD